MSLLLCSLAVNEFQELMQISTNLICTLDLPVSTDTIKEKVQEAGCSEDNEFDLERFKTWFLEAFGPFQSPEEEEEDWEEDEEEQIASGKQPTVPLPTKVRLGESWEIIPLRKRIQWHRQKGDVEGDRDLEKIYGLEDQEEEDPYADGWCPTCWYEFWTWYKLNRQRTKDDNPFLNEEIQYVAENFGSGVALFFYQWRYMMTINMIIFLFYAVFMILPWFMGTVRQQGEVRNWRFNATDGAKNWFQRDDATLNQALADISGSSQGSSFIADSFFFYSGYPGAYTKGVNEQSRLHSAV